jgi:hypothetical protein
LILTQVLGNISKFRIEPDDFQLVGFLQYTAVVEILPAYISYS